MIVTVTPNPSLDVTLTVDRLERGRVHRASTRQVDPGGKGINVARALAVNGHAVRAVVPVGGNAGHHLESLLTDVPRLELLPLALSGETRSNVALNEADGTTTKINEPGPLMNADEVDRLVATVVDAAADARWVVLAGSLPPGPGDDLYGRLVDALHAVDVRVAVDTSGPALQRVLAHRPDLIKPNVHELGEAVGRELRTVGDLVGAATELQQAGIGGVLASAGPDGAVIVDGAGHWHGTPPAITPRSTVGAGDAMLAGYLAAGARGPEALTESLAWGSAATALPGSRMPGPADLDRAGVRLHEHPDLEHVLEEARSL
ncbi:MAG: 1-phosphofructokinase [Patulibacter sp.]